MSTSKSLFLLATAGVRTSVSSSPFSTLGCPETTAGDGSWVWETSSSPSPSCDLSPRGDIAAMCVDSTGQVDPTSIFVDATATNDRTGCFVWNAAECEVDMLKVSKIEFDMDFTMCDTVWAAPLWLTPLPWEGPGGASGEIDFVEMCPVGEVRTNFAGCEGGGSGCVEDQYASGLDSQGPKHYVMSMNGASLSTEVCELDGLDCKASGYYTNYLNMATPTSGRSTSFPYIFKSDIWNGHGGDGGWSGCGAQNNPDTKCTYAIRNIRVHTLDGVPMFSGRCSALNPSSPAASCSAEWGSCTPAPNTGTCLDHLNYAMHTEGKNCEAALEEVHSQCSNCAGCGSYDCQSELDSITI